MTPCRNDLSVSNFIGEDEALREEAQEIYLQNEREDQLRADMKNANFMNKQGDMDDRIKEKSILKVQKFVNRLKRFGKADKAATLDELNKVDIGMHLSEVCDALCDADLKLKDIFALMEVCSLAYRQYTSEFSSAICASAFRSFRDSSEISVPANAVRRRTLARLLFELVLIGVCQDADALPKVINDLCDMNRPAGDQLAYHNVAVLEMLCRKFDSAVLGSPSGSRQRALDAALGRTLERKCCLSRVTQAALRSKLSEFYRSNAAALLQQAKGAVEQQTKVNQQRKIAKGSVDAEYEAKYQALLQTLNRLRGHIEGLGDLLSQPVPTLEVEIDNTTVTRIQADPTDQTVSKQLDNRCGLESAWEDDAEKDFYTNILNLADAVPGSLLGIELKDAVPSIVDANSEPIEDEVSIDDAESSLKQPVSADTVGGGLSPNTASLPSSNNKADIAEKKNLILDQFFEKLCQATLGAEVDGLAMNFFYDQLNTGKNNRKRLAKLLLSSHRNDLYVLPVLARFIATIAPYCKDVAQAVTEGALNDYREISALKDAMKAESRIKAARFLAELCKFQQVPTGTLLELLQELLEDFSYLNVEVACNIVQSCGRYLLLYKGLGERFQNTVVVKLMRMKTVRNLPVHLEVMVEDTYYQLFPAEKKGPKKKEIPIIRQYINYLIEIELPRGKESQLVRSIRALDWSDDCVRKWLRKSIHNTTTSSTVAFPSLANIASLLCALAPGHPDFVIECVDDLYESIQLGMERNDFRDLPFRFREIKLLGELFNYRLLDSAGILDTLYHLLGFGGPTSFRCSEIQSFRRLASINNSHLLTSPEQLENLSFQGTTFQPLQEPTAPIDSTSDYFRIRLVCLLLHTSGQFFNRGAAKEKLDFFLCFFQRYIFFKSPLPMNIQYVVSDMLQALRPKTKQLESICDIDKNIAELLLKKESLSAQEVREREDEEERSLENAESADSVIIDDEGEQSEPLDIQDSSVSEEEAISDKNEIVDDEDVEAVEKSLEAMEEELFDLELSNVINDSLRDAKSVVTGIRGRAVDDIRLPNLSKIAADLDLPEDRLRVRLITRKGKDKVHVKALDIPKESRLSQALYYKETEDAEEHAKLKQFVLDSVVRSRKQEVTEKEMEIRRQLFSTGPMLGRKGSAGQRFVTYRANPVESSFFICFSKISAADYEVTLIQASRGSSRK